MHPRRKSRGCVAYTLYETGVCQCLFCICGLYRKWLCHHLNNTLQHINRRLNEGTSFCSSCDDYKLILSPATLKFIARTLIVIWGITNCWKRAEWFFLCWHGHDTERMEILFLFFYKLWHKTVWQVTETLKKKKSYINWESIPISPHPRSPSLEELA